MRIGVIGLGLVGGSIALALHSRHEVIGFDNDAVARHEADRSGVRVVDRLEGLAGLEAVIVATPIPEVVPTLERLAALSDGAVLLDTASLKGAIADFATRAPDTARIVGGHPMAGGTSRGFAAADPALFRRRPFLIVPTARSDDQAMTVAGAIARECGGIVTVCSPKVHDRAMAWLIAAPLAAAAALAVAGASASPLLIAAGPGFRDATRLADTPDDLALELLFANAEAARAAIASVAEGLSQLQSALDRGDRDHARRFLELARSVRAELGGHESVASG